MPQRAAISENLSSVTSGGDRLSAATLHWSSSAAYTLGISSYMCFCLAAMPTISSSSSRRRLRVRHDTKLMPCSDLAFLL